MIVMCAYEPDLERLAREPRPPPGKFTNSSLIEPRENAYESPEALDLARHIRELRQPADVFKISSSLRPLR